MFSHDILTLSSQKAIEYVIALTFLASFVPFWRFVNGQPAAAAARVAARAPAMPLVEWFRVATDALFHPGHAWARVAGPGLVRVGLDDFAQKLVGPLARVELPAVGTALTQGDRAWRLRVDGKAVDMLSPVDGVVTAVNRAAVDEPGLVNRDPFGQGWLLEVRGPRVDTNLKGLLSGRLARRWVEDATDALRLRMAPELGLVLQDGGMPVDGIAHAIDAERWDEVAREFLLS